MAIVYLRWTRLYLTHSFIGAIDHRCASTAVGFPHHTSVGEIYSLLYSRTLHYAHIYCTVEVLENITDSAKVKPVSTKI